MRPASLEIRYLMERPNGCRCPGENAIAELQARTLYRGF
jgi:hypothetical protein